MSKLTLRVSLLELSVFDSEKQLVLRKSLNTDAFAPSISVIGNQIIVPGTSLDVFNPFFEFEDTLPLVQLQYSVCFLKESNDWEKRANRHRLAGDCDYVEELTVSPRSYEGKTSLILPLQGKFFVWEGHDLYAHHLRVPLSDPRVRARGITANSNQFASDFIYLDPHGHAYHDDPRKLENWYSYGKPVFSPGSGVIVATANDIPDNWFEDAKATKIAYPKLPQGKDVKDIGNFVLIDHQDGEYSLLVHMKPGSVSVKAGDPVHQGQRVGRVGFSGDSIFPHLHYSLMEGPEVFKAWGIPSYFRHFRRGQGTSTVQVSRGPVDSGDVVESEAEYSSRQ